ncbi:MAG: carboxypeptidase-like regulatory domain-containing protein [Candidatus Acidiferrum sp.]
MAYASRIAGLFFISFRLRLALFGLIVLTCSLPSPAQTEQSPIRLAGENNPPNSPIPKMAIDALEDQQKAPGTITGSVVGQDGVAVAGANVKLMQEGQSVSQEITTSENGQFTFTNVAPGSFQLVITSEGFAEHTSTGVLESGENFTAPQVSMVLATNVTEVHVGLSITEIAQEQMKDEEKQRVLGVIPNFYVSYAPNAAPLSPKQKLNLAWRLTIDPVSILLAGQAAGMQQARNEFSGYGQGAQGYAKRFGAAYADFTISNFLGSAVFPSIFKQDPRYLYKGTGSTKSRVRYALANAVICRGDNGHWQINYSGIIGSLAAGSISNLYYPASDRHGPALTFENTAMSIASTAVFNLMQEFVLRKLTSKVPNTPNSSNPNQL